MPASGELIRLIINVEAQGDFHPGYPLTKRGIFYCCRMISAQYGTEFTESRYQDIKKVYSIWIAVKPPKERENTINRYRIVEENLVGNVKEPVRNYDLLSMLMICLGDPETAEHDILKLLDVLLSNEIEAAEKQRVLQHDFDIPMTKELERGIHDMCNLGETIARESIAKGFAKGRAEGLAKGMTNGILASIKNLMETMGLTIEQAMSALKVPDTEKQKYMDLLERR